MLALAIALVTLAAIVAVAGPLLRPAPEAPPDGEAPALEAPVLEAGGDAADLAVYRDQLAEIDRDQARGVLGAAEAREARLEIQRRVLAAAARPARGAGATRGRAVALALIVAAPLLAVGAYLWTGAPGLPDRPLAARDSEAAPAAGADPELERIIRELAAALETNPEDVGRWTLLARSLLLAGRHADSAEAYQHLIRLVGDTRPELWAARGEALVLAAKGIVTPAARESFARAPGEPRSRFYLADAKAQAGDLAGALADWVALEADAPGGAPWRAFLRDRITATARQLGQPVPPEPVPPEPGPPAAAPPPPTAAAPADGGALPAPSAEGMEAILRLPEAERQGAIRSMVEGLHARLRDDPSDRAGWLRLARAYRVLNDPPALVSALQEAVAAHPRDATLLSALAQAQLDAAGGDRVLAPAFLDTVDQLHRVEPDNPQALWYLGRAASEAGDGEAARRHWTRLLALLPAESPARAELARRLAALSEAGAEKK